MSGFASFLNFSSSRDNADGQNEAAREVVVDVDSTSAEATKENMEQHSLFVSKTIAHCSEQIRAHGETYALETAFRDLDMNKDGTLDRSDLELFFAQAVQHIKLEMDDDIIIPAAVDALMEDAGVPEGVDHVTKEQFMDIFQRHPDLMCCFEDELGFSERRQTVREYTLDRVEPSLDPEEERDNQEVWSHIHGTRWKNNRVHLVWCGMWLAANIFAFTYKGIKYARRDDAMDVFGNCIIVARGSAQCLNLNCGLILLPICRHFLTRLRATSLRFAVPFDVMLEYHIYIGCAIAIFATTHVAAHICDFYRFARVDEEKIFALFDDKLGDDIPESKAGRWGLMLSTRAGVTGIVMVVCMIIAYPLTLRRRQNFNGFWYSHHLLLIMILALCIHGTDSLLEPYQSVYWVIFPLTLYFWRRLQRETPACSRVDVLEANVFDDDVVRLKLSKPHSWDHVVRAGMYGVINIPQVSRFEWHPFTLTSSPFENFIEFHFRKVGDWTSKVFALVNSYATEEDEEEPNASDRPESGDGPSKMMEDSLSVRRSVPADATTSLTVKVEGPIGASSQGFSDFPIVVLVGAGIGVTPMISVLKQLLVTPGRMKRTFFYWTTRDVTNLKLFTKIVDDIYDSDQKHCIQLRHFLTSVKQDDRDLGSVLFHHATRAKHKRTNFDILLGRHVHHQVEVGRPDWKEELDSIKTEAKDLGHRDCGIFLCGPERMATAIADVSFDLSKEDPDFHFYFTKETF